MKRILSLLTALMLTVSCLTVCAGAVDLNSYTFEDYSLSLPLPEGYYAFTQDMEPDDPLFTQFSISYEDEMDYLTGGGAYNTILNITDALNTFDLCVDVYPDSSPALTDYSAAELEEFLVSWLAATYETNDALTLEGSAVQIYQGIPYLTAIYRLDTEDGTYRTVDCFTILNGYDYWFSLYSNLEEVSQPMAELLARLLTSVTYDGTAPTLAESWEPLTLFAADLPLESDAPEPEPEKGTSPVLLGVLSGLAAAGVILGAAGLLRKKKPASPAAPAGTPVLQPPEEPKPEPVESPAPAPEKKAPQQPKPSQQKKGGSGKNKKKSNKKKKRNK